MMNEPPAMQAGDYLWDRSGPVDAFVAELESVLAPLKHRGRVPAVARRAPVARWLAIAAVLLLAAGAAWYFMRPAPAGPVSWTVASAVGRCSVGEPTALKSPGGPTARWVDTGEGSSAVLEGKRGGLVHLEANTRVQLIDVGDQAQRVMLSRGQIYTEPTKTDSAVEVVTAAGTAVVTPGTACMFAYGESRQGVLETKDGLVEFKEDGRLVRVPSSAVVAFSERDGVGTPRQGKASPRLVGMLSKFDATGRDSKARGEMLGLVLAAAGPGDDITLWNLMWKLEPEERKLVLARARDITKWLGKLPEDDLINLNPTAMDIWWKDITRR